MRHRSRLCLSIPFLCLASIATLPAPAARAAAAAPSGEVRRPQGYLHLGIGIIEVAHLQGGVFLSPRLTVDGMVAWAAVFGTRWGGGLTYAIGPLAGPGRPPRHAFLIGARVMLDEKLAFDTHGDDASSYFITPVGYGFLTDRGFSLRLGVGPVIGRSSDFKLGESPGRRHWFIGGPFFTVSAGFWF